MTSLPKVIFIIPSFAAGGTQNYLLRFCKYTQNRFDITVLAHRKVENSLEADFHALELKVKYQSLGYFNLAKAYRFRSFLKENRFDTICNLQGNFAGLSLCLAQQVDIPNRVAFYRRSSPAFTQNFKNKLYFRFANKWVNNYATKILSNSEFAFKAFFPHLNTMDNRFHVIFNGVEKSLFEVSANVDSLRCQLKIPQSAKVICHVGRWDAAKNHQTIFKTAAILQNKIENVFFLFCGMQTDSKQFKALLREYGIGGFSLGLGLHGDIGKILKASDAFIFPSITEGQPNALIEAMMANLPVVVSDIEPLKVMFPQNTSLPFHPPLQASSFAETLKKILQDTNFAENFKFQAFAEARFNFSDRFEEFVQVLSPFS